MQVTHFIALSSIVENTWLWVYNLFFVCLFCFQKPTPYLTTPSQLWILVNISFTNPVSQSCMHMQKIADGKRLGSQLSFLYNWENWEALFSKRILCSQQRTDWDCSVTSKGIVVFELIELKVICWIGWQRERKSTRKGKKDMREWKRGLRNRERKREVKLMFGQMEKDGWELMEWVKEAEEAAQLGLIRHSSFLHPALHTSLLLPSLPHPALY